MYLVTIKYIWEKRYHKTKTFKAAKNYGDRILKKSLFATSYYIKRIGK